MPPPTHVLIEFAASDGSPSVEWQLAIEDEDREFITVAELRTRIHAECALPIAAGGCASSTRTSASSIPP